MQSVDFLGGRYQQPEQILSGPTDVSSGRKSTSFITPFSFGPVSRRFALLALFGALVIPFLGEGQTPPTAPRPDFSGRWRMVKDKSDFGGFTIPDAVIQVVDHHDPTLNVHTVETIGSKTTSADVSYFTDGSVTKNVINGRNAESKAFWDGPALMIRTTEKDSKDEDVVIEDRWELSDDGQTLTRTSHVTTPKGQVDMKLVSVKEKVEG